jgi:aspartate/methionine/tyrosine aminotransferase
MDPLAVQLNDVLQSQAPETFALLSDLGKELFFPKGILSQSAEAKQKAHTHNATIGMATEDGGPMHLACIQQYIPELDPSQTYPYAPGSGRPELRKAWQAKLLEENPMMREIKTSLPVVTQALTHGLSIVGDLFIERGDVVILPAHFWGNYKLTWCVRRGAVIRTFTTYTDAGGFNVDALREALAEVGRDKGKAIVVLNFPNNPTGYTPTVAEADAIADVLVQAAEAGTNVLAVTDDAYFGLTYEDGLCEESIFGRLVGKHPRLNAVKLCGPTKELYVWGFRVGFLTYGLGVADPSDEVYEALVKKTMGIIRGTISNCSNLSQTLMVKALADPGLAAERKQKYELMAGRGRKCREVLADPKYADAWELYPFNSGYFLCLRLLGVEAETLRVHLLDKHGVGAIASAKHDLRIAFSCIAAEDIQDLFDTIYKAAKEV